MLSEVRGSVGGIDAVGGKAEAVHEIIPDDSVYLDHGKIDQLVISSTFSQKDLYNLPSGSDPDIVVRLGSPLDTLRNPRYKAGKAEHSHGTYTKRTADRHQLRLMVVMKRGRSESQGDGLTWLLNILTSSVDSLLKHSKSSVQFACMLNWWNTSEKNSLSH